MSATSPRRIIFTVINDLTTDQRMHRICHTLQSNGFEVTLTGRKLKYSRKLSHFPFNTHRIRCWFSKGKLFYLEYHLRLLLYLLFHKADIYGAVDADTLLPALLASKFHGSKFTYDAHEFFTEVPEVHQRKLTQKIWRWIEDLAVPKADCCYTVSNGLAQRYSQRYQKSFTVIRNVALKSIIREPKFPGNTIIYQGAVNRGRGLEELIEAMPAISAKLLIAGVGDEFEKLQELVKQMGLEDKVRFTGQLTPEELRKLTSKAHLGYNVLKNDGWSYYHSLANKCFDYLQAGIPVLTSPFPEYAALAAEYSFFIFSTAHADALASSVNTFFAEAKLRQALEAECEKAAAELNWENEQLKLLRLYRML